MDESRSRGISRRRFVAALAGGVLTAAGTRSLLAQATVNGDSTLNSTRAEIPGSSMEGDGWRPVRRPAKPGAVALLTDAQRDDVERKLACPCPCTLDVFTCRTSMPCGFSPAMHGDVRTLIAGGYDAGEIVAAFEDVYGEQILLAPRKEGFNWAGYLAPAAAIGAGGLVIVGMLRGWRRETPAPASVPSLPDDAARVDASPEELARLDAAVRGVPSVKEDRA